ncbi:MAG TPA: hypothetical protein PKD09_17000 [Aggregatilinea sp.]|uniref:hypothetical protein n=1 Tax=Aggregatilinea sp. TaxID=2806333 RepID=UPI002C290FAA|nr:hypothetical protein [Aggregatilinea sp.]HML23356.1 hypothetical protein [Aggregatilinea sp.]
MNDRKPIENTEDLVNAVDDLIENTLTESLEEADAFLIERGLDPDEIGRRFEQLAQQALSASPLHWKNRARAEIDRKRDQLNRRQRSNSLSRDDMLNAIRNLQRALARQAPARAYYRNLEEVTDEDLAGILAELEFLANDQEDNAE